MKLCISTPMEIIVEQDRIASLRAEDASGGFGIQPGHVDCITVLPVSLVSWRDTGGKQAGCAIGGGVLTVEGGNTIAISARAAIASNDLDQLEHTVLAELQRALNLERKSRSDSLHLQLRAIRFMMQALQSGQPGNIHAEVGRTKT